MKSQVVKFSFLTLALLFVTLMPAGSSADNDWNNYHWARRSNPFVLKIVDSNTSNWDDNLRAAANDWMQGQNNFDLTIVPGDDTDRTRKRCPMVSGQIRSCNAQYGNNGWLGLASINVSGGHITQGTSKMNDSYLATTRYTETNRQHVMCQEIGHDFGLGHQDESGADLNTCMDYANALDNPKPNSHDFNMLNSLYSHVDGTTTVSSASTAPLSASEEVSEDPNSWGQLMRQSENGRSSTYVREHSNGSKTITHVFWTHERAEICRGCDHRFHHH